MPLSSSTTSSRSRRSHSHSPTRNKLDDEELIAYASKPLRRGRKPSKRGVVRKTTTTQEPSTPDFDNSFNSSLTFNQSFSGMPAEKEEELDFLTKSPAGHQWRNKKLWQTNAGLAQKRYEEYSGRKSQCATPQGMERELRRADIRKSLMGAMDSMGVPDL
jgi:hypothetical protein